MKIESHEVDRRRAEELFRFVVEKFPIILDLTRKQDRPTGTILSLCNTISRSGAAIAPASNECKMALTVASQMIAAIMACHKDPSPGYSTQIWDGPAVTFKSAAALSEVYTARWIEGLQYCALTRNRSLIDVLKTVAVPVMRGSSTRGGEEAFQYCEVHQDLANGTLDPNASSFQHVRQWGNREAQKKGKVAKSVRFLLLPYLDVLEQYVLRDSAVFEKTLINAIQSHKRFYSSSEELRRDINGWISLPLTAIMALAWETGMRTSVESDYTPQSWVTGSWSD